MPLPLCLPLFFLTRGEQRRAVSADRNIGSFFAGRIMRGWWTIMNTSKIEELLAALKKKEEEKEKNTVLWALAIVGAVAAVAGIAFLVYRFFAPDYLEDFEEDFDDDFDDYFEDEEE